MNILFLTFAYPRIGSHNIYTDLLNEFIVHRHEIIVVCQNERRNKTQTAIADEDGKTVLRVRSLNITGDVGKAEKGAATLTIYEVFIRAVKRYLLKRKFDLILYSPSPITLGKYVRALIWLAPWLLDKEHGLASEVQSVVICVLRMTARLVLEL